MRGGDVRGPRIDGVIESREQNRRRGRLDFISRRFKKKDGCGFGSRRSIAKAVTRQRNDRWGAMHPREHNHEPSNPKAIDRCTASSGVLPSIDAMHVDVGRTNQALTHARAISERNSPDARDLES